MLSKLKKPLFTVLKAVLVTAFWVSVWDLIAYLVSRDNELMNIFLPTPATVFKTWREIAFTEEFKEALEASLLRILSGFFTGFAVGAVFGVLTNAVKALDWLISPLFKVIRAIPVAAITILFFAFYESEALPSAVVALMVAPLIWQTVYDGLGEPQPELSEMAKVYRLSRFKVMLYIKLPHLCPYLISNTINALGLAWKSGVAAEVIIGTSILGLGAQLKQHQGFAEYDEVYAITLTVVILSLFIELLLKSAVNRFLFKKEATK